jgi:hypothetical protein
VIVSTATISTTVEAILQDIMQTGAVAGPVLGVITDSAVHRITKNTHVNPVTFGH